jgi:hypothetical protein
VPSSMSASISTWVPTRSTGFRGCDVSGRSLRLLTAGRGEVASQSGMRAMRLHGE